MADDKQNILEKAQSRFLETQKKAAEKSKVWAEYKAEAEATAAKTAKLRALRLQKEEDDRAAAALAPAKKPKRASAAKVKKAG